MRRTGSRSWRRAATSCSRGEASEALLDDDLLLLLHQLLLLLWGQLHALHASQLLQLVRKLLHKAEHLLRA